MIWKPKEKELSLEEATALAKSELSAFWFGSEPLIVGIAQEDHFVAVPLDKKFNQKPWVIFFVDITEYSGETVLVFAKEWHKRYHANRLGVLFIIQPVYDYLKAPRSVQSMIDSYQASFPIVIDPDGALTTAFQAETPPRVVLLSENKICFQYFGPQCLDGTELQVQEFLRQTDPGLPLLPFFEPSIPCISSTNRIEFGSKPRFGKTVDYPAAGFIEDENGLRKAHFYELRPPSLEVGELFISGQWTQDHEKITTQDPSAIVCFKSFSSHVSLVAMASSKSIEVPFIQVEVNNHPAYDEIVGKHLDMEDNGESYLRVKEAKVYSMLKNLSFNQREVTLRFPTANLMPISLYGIRFGE